MTIGYYQGFYSLLRDEDWANDKRFRIIFKQYKSRVFFIRIQYGADKSNWYSFGSALPFFHSYTTYFMHTH
jgi:hypothetical protein